MHYGTKKMTFLAAAAGFLLAGGPPVAAADEDLTELRRQMEQLVYQNQQLTKRMVEIEAELRGARAVARAEQESVAAGGAEGEDAAGQIGEYVTLSGTIEVEAATGEDFSGESFTDASLATAEIGLDVQMSEWASGHMLITYEDDALTIDEAFVILGDGEEMPASLSAGLFYVPFGSFETAMLQDPLTLEIGEIRAAGVGLDLGLAGLGAAVYAYKGMNEMDVADTVGVGARLSYELEFDPVGIAAGMSWVSNIGDSGGITGYLDEMGAEGIEDQVGGFGADIMITFGPVTMIGEYVQALDSFAELEFAGGAAEPKAWSLEAVYSTAFGEKDTTFAIGVQGTDEATALGLPEQRAIAAASMMILPATTLTLEYYHDEDYGVDDGGTGESADVLTTQLRYEF